MCEQIEVFILVIQWPTFYQLNVRWGLEVGGPPETSVQRERGCTSWPYSSLLCCPPQSVEREGGKEPSVLQWPESGDRTEDRPAVSCPVLLRADFILQWTYFLLRDQHCLQHCLHTGAVSGNHDVISDFNFKWAWWGVLWCIWIKDQRVN